MTHDPIGSRLSLAELGARLSGSRARGVQAAFEGLSALLGDAPEDEACQTLAEAALDLTGAEAAWLIVFEEAHWHVAGRAWHAERVSRALNSVMPMQLMSLTHAGQLVGALALWRSDGASANPLEAAFEQALADALAARRELLQAHREVLHDPLTGLYNRRAIAEELTRLAALAQRSGRPLALVMLDLDDFKAVNDRDGHEAGDAVLKSTAEALRQALRTSDVPLRYGGEEFLVALPETAEAEALLVAERLRAAIAARQVVLDGKRLTVTASLGVAILGPHEALDAAIARADGALYAAKRAGKNRCAAAPLTASDSSG